MRCLAVWNFSIKYLNSEKKRAKTHEASTITTTRKLPLHNKYLIKVTGNVQFFLVIKRVYTQPTVQGELWGRWECEWVLRKWITLLFYPEKKNRAEKLTSSAMQPLSTSPSQTRLLWQMKDMKNNTEKRPRRGRESASQCKFHVTAEKVDQLSTQQPTRVQHSTTPSCETCEKLKAKMKMLINALFFRRKKNRVWPAWLDVLSPRGPKNTEKKVKSCT